MGYDTLEEMERNNGKMYDDYYSNRGKENEMDDDT